MPDFGFGNAGGCHLLRAASPGLTQTGVRQDKLEKASVVICKRYLTGEEPGPMASDQVKRTLVAILAADVAGYSRLMGAR